VEGADNAAFEDAPEALNRIGVDCAHNILPSGMGRWSHAGRCF
jgi:D-arabinose 5-phosphate isomerase GutQ